MINVDKSEFPESITFGEYFKKKRKLLGVNQLDFAEILGVNAETIGRWESGKSSPPIEKAREIIDILGGELKIINFPDKDDPRINELVSNYLEHGITQAVL